MPSPPRVDPLWDALERDESLPTTRRLGVSPHLSLAVYAALDTQNLLTGLAGLARGVKPTEITLANIGIFADRVAATIFLGPAASRAPLDLHDSFHRGFAENGDDCLVHYRPGQWVPHLTLAQDVALAALPVAIARLAAVMAPIAGTLDALSVARHLPVERLGRYAFG